MVEIFCPPCVILKLQQSNPCRSGTHANTRQSTNNSREREPQSNNTGDDERAKAKDKRRPTTNDNNRRSTVNRRRSRLLRLRNAEQGEAAIKYLVCVFVQESGFCVCGLCVVLLFAALFERLICSFPTPLRLLRPPPLPLCVLAIVEGPFQGHPANTFAVLLATLVVDKQCLVACAWRRRCGAVEVNRRQRKRQRRSSQQSKQQNTQRNRKRYVPKKREAQRNGGTHGQTDGQRNSQKTTINQNSRTNTRNITFHSPQRSHQHQSQ